MQFKHNKSFAQQCPTIVWNIFLENMGLNFFTIDEILLV